MANTLFDSLLNSSVIQGNYLQQTIFSDAFISWRFKGKIIPWSSFFLEHSKNKIDFLNEHFNCEAAHKLHP